MSTPPSSDEGIGARIATLRKAAGLSQVQLAARASVSTSLLSKVEIGDRTASHALITAVAQALHIPIERLHGQPYEDGPDPAAIDQLRGVVRVYDMPPDADLDLWSAPDLRRNIAQIAGLRRDGKYGRLAVQLPDVLTQAAAAAYTATGDESRDAYRLLVSALYAAHGLAYRLGYPDLSESIEHKLMWAAQQADDPHAVALASWTHTSAFAHDGDYGRGLLLLDRAQTTLTAAADASAPATVTVLGSIHLRAADLASRHGDSGAVREHLKQAYQLAEHRGDDRIDYHLTFGLQNVRIHDMAAHAELGQPDNAVQVGDRFTPAPDLAPTRAGHYYIELARARLLTGDRDGALRDLQTARRIAPEPTLYHPDVRDTTAVLLSLHRRSNPDLTQLAAWLHLT